MCTVRETFLTYSLLCLPGVRLVNRLQKDTQYFDTYS